MTHDEIEELLEELVAKDANSCQTFLDSIGSENHDQFARVMYDNWEIFFPEYEKSAWDAFTPWLRGEGSSYFDDFKSYVDTVHPSVSEGQLYSDMSPRDLTAAPQDEEEVDREILERVSAAQARMREELQRQDEAARLAKDEEERRELERLAAEAAKVPLPEDDEVIPEDEEPIAEVEGGGQPQPKNISAPAAKEDRKGGKLFWMEQDSMMRFTDSLLQKGEKLGDILPAERKLMLMTSVDNAPSFEAKRLTEGQTIASLQNFGVDEKKKERVGALLQDHKGRIFDHSTSNLLPEEKNLVALKMAKMMLTNYPGYGDIIISAPVPSSKADIEQANKVYASLLYLKSQDPSLKDIKIISLVKDCNGPKNSSPAAEKSYIEKYLKDSLPTASIEKTHVSELAVHQNALRERIREAKGLGRESSEVLKEGDTFSTAPKK
ncbi:Uncharacterised protein (plasmid) [Legionella adelaidensis]|uniref:Uncharacterized protein n=1 Tax=Legionella adelaidensis TaxID=45056 RepID=A0A0W0R3D0_9GAMM|nr:hypothetical protein [Legionella adelaidensis]KTC65547.1 hypothetical protein Lade_0205 [Legionella adelaidensis]VEH84632.1 Uncharacterised protein [Legionella adelaidensis]